MTNLSIFSRSKLKSKTHARTRTQPQFECASVDEGKICVIITFYGLFIHFRPLPRLNTFIEVQTFTIHTFLVTLRAFWRTTTKKYIFACCLLYVDCIADLLPFHFFLLHLLLLLLLLLLCFLLSVCVPTWFRLNMLFLLFFCVLTARKMLAMTTMRHQ